jgi:cytochrome c-type biogenesis protein CcmH
MFSLPLLAAAAPILKADPAHGDVRLEKLFATFIAPCCWRANLLVHQSPKAEELRAEIEKSVSAGKTDDEIKATLIKQYSIRILALPEGVKGQWLSWVPIAAVSAGIGAVAIAIRQMQSKLPPDEAGPLPPLPDFE